MISNNDGLNLPFSIDVSGMSRTTPNLGSHMIPTDGVSEGRAFVVESSDPTSCIALNNRSASFDQTVLRGMTGLGTEYRFSRAFGGAV